jgi:hypothetical protein
MKRTTVLLGGRPGGSNNGSKLWSIRRSLLVAGVLLASTAEIRAETTFKVANTNDYLYNSNIFYGQAGIPATLGSSSQRGDSLLSYGAELDVDHLWQSQDWYATIAGTRRQYDHFSELNHDEYRLGGGWKWRAGRDFTGTFDVSRTQTMVPFYNLEQSAISLETEQRESATFRYQFLSRWSMEGSGYTRTLQEPLSDAPNLELRESDGGLILRYLGTSNLTAGVGAAYQNGTYANTNGTLNPDYSQWSVSSVASYSVSGRSTFNGSVGYSKRTSPARNDDLSGITGSLAYSSQITGKTSLAVTLSRAINNYVATTGSEIDSSVVTSVIWRATYKTSLALGYTWQYSQFPNQGALVATERLDHLQFASLNISYEALRWLSLKPYANLQTRSSNTAGFNFNATVYGLTAILHWTN